EMFELNFEHVGPSAFGRLVVRERIIAEWPGVSFAPEAVHERIDELDQRASVKLCGQLAYQIAECLLEEWVVKAWLIASGRVPQISLCRGAVFLITEDQINFRYIIQNKIRKGRVMRVVRGTHLDA